MSQPSPSPALSRSELGAEYLGHLSRLGTDPRELTERVAASELLAVGYGDRFLPGPVFLSTAERAVLADDLQTLHRLLTELPDRLFDGDPAAFAAAVGMNAIQTSVVCRAAATDHPLLPLARSDLYRDAQGFKMLEFNITSALGGFENADINREMLRHPTLSGFVDKHRLGYVDTLRGIVATLRAECAAHIPDGRRPVVAVMDWPESFVTYEPRLRVMAQLLEGQGIDAIPCHVGHVRERGDRLEVDGRLIDAVFRFFLVEEIFTEADLALVEPVLRAVDRGTVGMFSRLDAELYGNKGALALLSDERYASAFTERERACLDRFLPWTRPVRRTAALGDGTEAELAPYALAEQDDLILKPTLLHGGSGIVPGWTVSAAEWKERLAQAMDGPYVLQRRVRPAAERFPAENDEGFQELYLNWGVFLFDPAITGDDAYGGCIVRGSTDPRVGVVSMGGGARVGCCFHETQRPA